MNFDYDGESSGYEFATANQLSEQKEGNDKRIVELGEQLEFQKRVIEVLARDVSFARNGDDGKSRKPSEIIKEAEEKVTTA